MRRSICFLCGVLGASLMGCSSNGPKQPEAQSDSSGENRAEVASKARDTPAVSETSTAQQVAVTKGASPQRKESLSEHLRMLAKRYSLHPLVAPNATGAVPLHEDVAVLAAPSTEEPLPGEPRSPLLLNGTPVVPDLTLIDPAKEPEVPELVAMLTSTDRVVVLIDRNARPIAVHHVFDSLARSPKTEVFVAALVGPDKELRGLPITASRTTAPRTKKETEQSVLLWAVNDEIEQWRLRTCPSSWGRGVQFFGEDELPAGGSFIFEDQLAHARTRFDIAYDKRETQWREVTPLVLAASAAGAPTISIGVERRCFGDNSGKYRPFKRPVRLGRIEASDVGPCERPAMLAAARAHRAEFEKCLTQAGDKAFRRRPVIRVRITENGKKPAAIVDGLNREDKTVAPCVQAIVEAIASEEPVFQNCSNASIALYGEGAG